MTSVAVDCQGNTTTKFTTTLEFADGLTDLHEIVRAEVNRMMEQGGFHDFYSMAAFKSTPEGTAVAHSALASLHAWEHVRESLIPWLDESLPGAVLNVGVTEIEGVYAEIDNPDNPFNLGSKVAFPSTKVSTLVLEFRVDHPDGDGSITFRPEPKYGSYGPSYVINGEPMSEKGSYNLASLWMCSEVKNQICSEWL